MVKVKWLKKYNQISVKVTNRNWWFSLIWWDDNLYMNIDNNKRRAATVYNLTPLSLISQMNQSHKFSPFCFFSVQKSKEKQTYFHISLSKCNTETLKHHTAPIFYFFPHKTYYWVSLKRRCSRWRRRKRCSFTPVGWWAQSEANTPCLSDLCTLINMETPNTTRL